jgi:hypothetical protein
MTVRTSVLGLALAGVLALAAPARAQDAAGASPLATDDVHRQAGVRCEECHSPLVGDGPPGPVDAGQVSALCGQCHVREAEFYDQSVKGPLFAAFGFPACVTCHTNHAIVRPADDWIGFTPPAVCATCHSETSNGASVIAGLSEELGRLSAGIENAGDVLTRAEVAGMLVDDGLAALQQAREQQILAHVAVHAFDVEAITPAVAEGLGAAGDAERLGTEALAELRVRRQGLAVATLFILGFLITLWIKIRRLPPVS